MPAQWYQTTYYFRGPNNGPIFEQKVTLAGDGQKLYRRDANGIVLSNIGDTFRGKRDLLYYLGARDIIIGPSRPIWDVIDPATRRETTTTVSFIGTYKEDWIDATQKVKVTLSKSAGLSPSRFLFFGPEPHRKSNEFRMSDFKQFKGGLWLPMTVKRKFSRNRVSWLLFSDVRINVALPNSDFTMTVPEGVQFKDIRREGPSKLDKIVVPKPTEEGQVRSGR